MTVTHN